VFKVRVCFSGGRYRTSGLRDYGSLLMPVAGNPLRPLWTVFILALFAFVIGCLQLFQAIGYLCQVRYSTYVDSAYNMTYKRTSPHSLLRFSSAKYRHRPTFACHSKKVCFIFILLQHSALLNASINNGQQSERIHLAPWIE